MKFCTERDVFLSHGFCIYYIAVRAVRKQFGSQVWVCMWCSVRMSPVLQPPPPTAGGLTVKSLLAFLPHSLGCGEWPSATSVHTQDVRGSCRTLTCQLPADSGSSSSRAGLAAGSPAGLSCGTLPVEQLCSCLVQPQTAEASLVSGWWAA